MKGWMEYKFSDFVDINPKVHLDSKSRYSFVEMKNIDSTKKYCKPEQYKLLAGGSRFINGDTLFARITPCLENGKIAKVHNLTNSIGFGSTEFLVFRGKPKISDNDFVYYLSRWHEVRDFAEKHMEGSSGRQRVSKNCFSSLIINLPMLEEQRAISAVLSNLDDKIDLLQRQNATLEAMAEALFRQWFVAEAKEEWEEKKLSDMINLVGGGTPKTSMPNYWGGTIPWLSGGDIACHHKTFIFSSEKFITDGGLNNSAARLVPKYTTIITARGTVGKFCLTGKPMAFSQTNYGVMPKDNKNFFFTFLLIDYVVNTLKSAAYGSVFDTITSQLFDEVSIALPSKNVIEKFDSTVGVFFRKIFSNQKQIQTLQKLRDTLLPKLMSGEVRVSLD